MEGRRAGLSGNIKSNVLAVQWGFERREAMFEEQR
jgi:hypothetical protein